MSGDVKIASARHCNKPDGFERGEVGPHGMSVMPKCCGLPVVDDGGCSEGCCDDFVCTVCGYSFRFEWGD
jgi:hypothetical protein